MSSVEPAPLRRAILEGIPETLFDNRVERRNIYIPDLHIDSGLKVKTRDFR